MDFNVNLVIHQHIIPASASKHRGRDVQEECRLEIGIPEREVA